MADTAKDANTKGGAARKSYRSTPTKKIAAGFFTDMQMLLAKFVSNNSVRFGDFSKQWRETKFSLIFSGRKDQRELRFFIDETIPIILRLWIPTSTFQEKIFSLFMLYGIYIMQPIVPKRKIRLKDSHWDLLKDLLQQCTKEQHLDACYIMHWMMLEQCFHFVAHLKHRSPAMLNCKEEDTGSLAEVSAKVFADLDDMAHGGLLEQLSLLHDQYISMKVAGENPAVSHLEMVKTNIFDAMNRDIAVMQAKYKVAQEADLAILVQAQGDNSSEEDVSDVGTRRKRIIERQFAQMPNTRKGTRFEELQAKDSNLCIDTSPSSAESSPVGSPAPRQRKGAQKKSSQNPHAKSTTQGAEAEGQTSREAPAPAKNSRTTELQSKKEANVGKRKT